VKDAGLNHGQVEEAIVEHLFEDFEIAEERCRGEGVSVRVGAIGISL
jgi:hypothetical protein